MVAIFDWHFAGRKPKNNAARDWFSASFLVLNQTLRLRLADLRDAGEPDAWFLGLNQLCAVVAEPPRSSTAHRERRWRRFGSASRSASSCRGRRGRAQARSVRFKRPPIAWGRTTRPRSAPGPISTPLARPTPGSTAAPPRPGTSPTMAGSRDRPVDCISTRRGVRSPTGARSAEMAVLGSISRTAARSPTRAAARSAAMPAS